MRIVVNIRNLVKYETGGMDPFIYETMKRIPWRHPEHEFIFLSDTPGDADFISGDHIMPVMAGAPIQDPLSWYSWLEWKLPPLLKRYKADVFVSPGGFLPLRGEVKTCLLLRRLSFENSPDMLSFRQRRFLKRYAPKYARKATIIATLSEAMKKDIMADYHIESGKVNVVYPGVSGLYRPLSWEEREEVKKEFADGKEYLIYAGPIHPRENILGLLKAFSLLKIRLYPNMQMLLAGKRLSGSGELVASLDTYRFRQDVKILHGSDESSRARLIAGAYAMASPAGGDEFNVTVAEGLACGVPVIASSSPGSREAGGEAALYFDRGNVEDLAEKLCRLYKDEQLRGRLIQQGLSAVAKFSWERTAEQFWECITAAGNADKKY